MGVRTNNVFIAFLVAVLLAPHILHALIITEIMYDLPSGSDSGREWIEVYNDGDTLDLTSVRLSENGTNHKIAASGGSKTLPAGGYAVIADNPAKFRIDHAQFSGALFDSAFSLSNDGETIVLLSASSTFDTAACKSGKGGSGDGNSLNREQSGGAFVAREPSPGAAMSTVTLHPAPKPVASAVTPKKKTTTKTPAAHTVSNPDGANDLDQTAEELHKESQMAAVVIPENHASSSFFWAGVGALALAACAAVFAGRMYGKKEWDIIEE